MTLLLVSALLIFRSRDELFSLLNKLKGDSSFLLKSVNDESSSDVKGICFSFLLIGFIRIKTRAHGLV